MQYRVSRNGQVFGPYTLDELHTYRASGNVLLTDLADAEGSSEWVTVASLLGAPPSYGAPPAYGAPQAYGAAQAEFAPNLHWALLILFTVLTCGLFYVVWLGILGARMKKIVPSNSTWILYFAGIAGYLLYYVVTIAVLRNNADQGFRVLVAVVLGVTLLVARLRFRTLLEDYYSTVEPIHLALSGVMTFFFAEYYFQYHFNRIREGSLSGIYTR